MSRPTSVRFDEEEVRQLERIAKRQGTTVSGLIQKAVREFFLGRSREKGGKALLAYVRRHPRPVERSLPAIERRIQEGMRDAACR